MLETFSIVKYIQQRSVVIWHVVDEEISALSPLKQSHFFLDGTHRSLSFQVIHKEMYRLRQHTLQEQFTVIHL